jgi:hypothetical protein
MSRRAASFTQADAARLLRAAAQVAPGKWRVRLAGGELVIEAADVAQATEPPKEKVAPAKDIVL